ncbi:uncharacterized protein [Halyomorpha halys]|uniref:uncharacterized protein n=1 Tax=Halyomorpha halys TaxID=286706 RepID=UPI0006D508B8|nr:uncharacterized protein LOC106686232 [Halyomorpha halys]
MVTIRTARWLLCLFSALLVESSALDTANWMRLNMGRLGGRPLQRICIPGTHNSGMNQLTGGTAFAKPCNILNHSQSVRRQLELGVRYFDIRPIISGGKFKTGHYSKIPGGFWQGGNGQFIESIVNDINDFTRDHKEVVIISLSHSLNTDVGKKYRGFNQEEWERLFQLLDRTNNLFFAPGNVYIPAITLGDLTNHGNRAAVLFVTNDGGLNLGGRLGRGYFYWGNMQVYDKYAESDKVSTMFQDQINKMKQESPRRYFLLSWTLTQKAVDATMCPMGKSISKLAKEANSNFHKILPEVSEAAYPNIISVDYVENAAVAELAMAVNNKLNF